MVKLFYRDLKKKDENQKHSPRSIGSEFKNASETQANIVTNPRTL